MPPGASLAAGEGSLERGRESEQRMREIKQVGLEGII